MPLARHGSCVGRMRAGSSRKGYVVAQSATSTCQQPMVRTQLAKYARRFEAAAARTVAGPCSILRTAACA